MRMSPESTESDFQPKNIPCRGKTFCFPDTKTSVHKVRNYITYRTMPVSWAGRGFGLSFMLCCNTTNPPREFATAGNFRAPYHATWVDFKVRKVTDEVFLRQESLGPVKTWMKLSNNIIFHSSDGNEDENWIIKMKRPKCFHYSSGIFSPNRCILVMDSQGLDRLNKIDKIN